jgi:acyl phosphate:glycerol-3-phosphate acyltransferase
MPAPMGGFAYTWPFYACAVLAYLLGSIPFGLVLTKLAGYGDIRRIGSGNIGATNVLRTGNKGLAAATLLLDAGKGAVAVLVAERFGPDMAAIAAVAAFVGHLFPVWLRFKGGKGVATSGGILLALSWPVGLIAVVVWLGMAVALRYSSLAAISAAVAAPIAAWQLADKQIMKVIVVLAVLVLVKHHQNIRRLVRGEESKIKLSKA